MPLQDFQNRQRPSASYGFNSLPDFDLFKRLPTHWRRWVLTSDTATDSGYVVSGKCLKKPLAILSSRLFSVLSVAANQVLAMNVNLGHARATAVIRTTNAQQIFKGNRQQLLLLTKSPITTLHGTSNIFTPAWKSFPIFCRTSPPLWAMSSSINGPVHLHQAQS